MLRRKGCTHIKKQQYQGLLECSHMYSVQTESCYTCGVKTVFQSVGFGFHGPVTSAWWHDGVAVVDRCAVVGLQGVGWGAQHTALWGPRAEAKGHGGVRAQSSPECCLSGSPLSTGGWSVEVIAQTQS